jgi:hypothetical protein
MMNKVYQIKRQIFLIFMSIFSIFYLTCLMRINMEVSLETSNNIRNMMMIWVSQIDGYFFSIFCENF